MELNGKISVITGASGRLGGEIAKALGRAGCDCVCHYNTNEEKADELVEQIRSLGVKAVAVGADLSDPKRIETLFEKAAELGTPQVLINSAGVFSRQPLQQITSEDALRLLDLNVIVPILTSRVFAKMLEARFGDAASVVGKIINMSDVGGIRPWGGYVLYCSSKAALIGATKALAKELAPSICVNSVAPGLVTWPSDFDEAERKRQLSFIPANRPAEITEVTRAIVFLLSNDYVTGQVLNVDGGRCI